MQFALYFLVLAVSAGLGIGIFCFARARWQMWQEERGAEEARKRAAYARKRAEMDAWHDVASELKRAA